MYRTDHDYDDTTTASHAHGQQPAANIITAGHAPDVALKPIIEACATTERVVERLLHVS